MGVPIGYFEISTGDSDKSQKFYSELFGWDINVGEYGYGMIKTGADSGIGGGIRKLDEQSTAPSVLMYAVVDDVEANLEKAGSLGGKTEVEPYEIPGVGKMAVFSDPDGNKIGLWKQAW
ncbi:VOC family protein [Labedaea rhizosphaerae]|uniref:VOC domain-containing protein n=1 Tax=Labedaea rhizosphaerae TaxID=598644 RepID=A0A4R6SG60_LABRH|nr:VOC family protein [Labedaea rhizosphaerae]TDQ00346.1 hypothetical protein EV186_102207 [Labedaea rhizosphaerae]